MDLFVEGKINAFLAAPPELQEVRAKNIGHVIVSSITDRPWSQSLFESVFHSQAARIGCGLSTA
jgi:hypothetical protein